MGATSAYAMRASPIACLASCCLRVHRRMRCVSTCTYPCILECGRYVLDMGRYDMDFDIRDRARMMRAILVADHSPLLRDKAHALFLSSRQPPEFVAPSKGKGAFVLNTLSHLVSHQVPQRLMSRNDICLPTPYVFQLPITQTHRTPSACVCMCVCLSLSVYG